MFISLRSIKLFRLWEWSAVVLTVVFVAMVFFKRGEKPAMNPKETEPSSLATSTDQEDLFSPETLVAAGKITIFGTDNPTLNSSGRLPVGKGQCAFCHIFVAGQNSDRCPNLMQVEARSHLRPKEARYKMFAEKYSSGEPLAKIKPHAKTGGEYLIESLYCPSCYVVQGFGKEGSNDEVSKMPIINEMPMALSDYQMVAVASYLQEKDNPGDYSKVTAKADWERYFKKELPPPPEEASFAIPQEKAAKVALIDDTPEEIIEKMGCFVCHKIPTVPIAVTGIIGPLLTLKTNAVLRLKSPEYQLAIEEGRAHATTPREYVKESILHPGDFLVPEYRAQMPTDYEKKFTMGALDNLVDFLLTLDESMVQEIESEEEGDEDETADPPSFEEENFRKEF